MIGETAVLDACVLYPAPLRDFLMHLTLAGGFHAKWTSEIHEEWIRNVLKNRPDLNRGQLVRTRELMDAHALDALVSGYEFLIPSLQLPDEEDRHVLAAAIVSRADAIVTFNLNDFPESELSKYQIEAKHPDTFIFEMLEENPTLVLIAARNQRSTLKNPPRSPTEFLETLEQQQLPLTASELRKSADLI
jgi:hypothetical protein